MECFIVEPRDVSEEALVLRGDEAYHAIKVLRLRDGEKLLATNLIGNCYECAVSGHAQLGPKELEVRCTILDAWTEFGEPERKIVLIQGILAQPARWEMLLEKATELGVTAISPVLTLRTEPREPKRDRGERILRAAVKQTRRARLPELRELSTLTEALHLAREEGRQILMLHEAAERSETLQKALIGLKTELIALVVGPEGGFSDQEVTEARDRFGASIVSLGTRRLRAETAAIAALAIAIDK